MTEQFKFADEKFADIQMLRYRLDGFETLPFRQKLYIYYLAKATICGRDITTDQFGRYNLKLRKILEKVYITYRGDRTDKEFVAFETYLKRVWFSNGIHHHYGCEKFVAEFSEDFFRKVVADAFNCAEDSCQHIDDAMLDELCKVVFDPAIQPKRVDTGVGKDMVVSSSCNYYDGVTQKEVEDYYESLRDPSDETPVSYGLNSTLRKKKDGTITEDVWCENGLYGDAIKHIIYWLDKASEVAENDRQSDLIRMLIEYYKTGDLKLFDNYSIEWLKEHEGRVDFINGFIEVYGDPLGIKASWEGIVTYKDMVATKRTQTISSNAQWFEDHSPVDPRFRKPQVVGVTANVVCAAMLGGDEYPSTAIGINLPNADWIRARYGSKSITICNLMNAYSEAAKGNGFLDEFVIDQPTRELIEKYGDMCDDLHTDLHECLGHGSGRLLAGVSADALSSYGSTIEEARADLFGLYYLADPKMVELNLVPNAEAYRSQYYTYMMNGLLTQLTRIQPGNQIEEAHMRNRALIARWTLKHYPSAVAVVKQNAKTYVQITDYKLLRDAFATLLAEIQRIKSEGDYNAAKQLVEEYAISVEPKLHEEIIARYKSLGIAPYKGFINPHMKAVYDEDGEIKNVELDYSETYAQQMLRYSREYGFL